MDYTTDYVQILKESLERKLKLLEQIADYNNIQKEICAKEPFAIEEYDEVVTKKSDLADEIEKIDEGFTLVYNRVAEVLKTDKDKYRDDIAAMQGYISEITDMISSIQADERRLFDTAKDKLANRKKDVGVARKSNQMAANYYRSMAGTSSEPQFMDKKN